MFGSKGEKRSFRADWCEKYDWLHYDRVADAAFCHLCMTAERKNKFLAMCSVCVRIRVCVHACVCTFCVCRLYVRVLSVYDCINCLHVRDVIQAHNTHTHTHTHTPGTGFHHITYSILSYLDDARSLCRAEKVCSNWYQVIAEEMLWKKLIQKNVISDPVWRGLSERREW